MVYEIKRGLNLPIEGPPVQSIEPGPEITNVAVLGNDYIGMKPSLMVKEGDKVKLGQKLFEDRKTSGVFYTSPAAGVVQSINRGDKRAFLSIVIDCEGDAEETFEAHKDLNELQSKLIQLQMIESGLWTALRTRPFSKVPVPGTEPHSIFVTAMDTNPLSPEPELIIAQNAELFVAGLTVLSKMTEGKTYVCTREDSRVPGEKIVNVEFEQFDGPHPSGLVGTHINLVDPVGGGKVVWHIGYQDVIAVGHLFTTGKIMTDRVVAVAGPRVTKPKLVQTRLGANIDQLLAGNITGDNNRVISGSVLSGRKVEAPENFLGRYHSQVAVLEEGNKREFLGWQKPGGDKYSVTKIYLGSWLNKVFPLTTSTGGSRRSMVPVGTYERVMPLDMLPTQLLRSLIVGDTDLSQQLGCLELDEEDLALCTFVCPGKYDYGKILRENLTVIEKDG